MGMGHLTMSGAERARKVVLERVVRGELSLLEASCVMGVSYRHSKRLLARYRSEGDAGLVHRSRGRLSTRAKPEGFRACVLACCREELCELGPTLASEKLAERGLVIDHETLRRWLMEDGQWRRHRSAKAHRSRRERKAQFGEMVQLDGSHHRWFGAERDSACLMNLVDDATGTTLSYLAEEETTEAAMRALWKWVSRYGIPRALYLDRKSVYMTSRPPTLEEQLADKDPVTVFGAACEKLSIKLITAYSPQAKGRVERNHAVYQDRFCHELRLQGITTIAGANELLEGGFVDSLNRKFAKPPRDRKEGHRPVPAHLDLRDVFCIDELRTVSADWCIRHDNRYYQIARLNTPLPKPADKIIVRQWLDGTLHLVFKNRKLTYSPIEEPPARPQAPKPTTAAKSIASTSSPKHPWRKPCLSAYSR